MKSIFEEMGGTYRREGDYLIPNLELPDTEFAITMEAFTAHEKWLQENLNEEARKRFDELISCHNNIVNTMSYENFRTGFQLGVMMVMEAVSENETTFFEL